MEQITTSLYTDVSLELGKYEEYIATDKIWPVKKAEDVIDGIKVKFSNMFAGFDFDAAGTVWKDSERLYLCGEFSLDTPEHYAIQQELCEQTSGYAAKRFIKSKYKKLIRDDFQDFRLQWMLYCVWQKVLGSREFRNLLLSIPDDIIIVEDTTTDKGGTAEVWGCSNKALDAERKVYIKEVKSANTHLSKKALKELLGVERNRLRSTGIWRGENNMGKILMICRRALKTGGTPPIDYQLLDSKDIYIHGLRLSFPTSESNNNSTISNTSDDMKTEINNTIKMQDITDENLKNMVNRIEEDEEYDYLSDEFVDTNYITPDWHYIYDIDAQQLFCQYFDSIEGTACNWLYKVAYTVNGEVYFNLFDTRDGTFIFSVPMQDIQNLDGMFSALFVIKFDDIVQLYDGFNNKLMLYHEYTQVNAVTDGNELVCTCIDAEGNSHEEKIVYKEKSSEELKTLCDAYGIPNDL